MCVVRKVVTCRPFMFCSFLFVPFLFFYFCAYTNKKIMYTCYIFCVVHTCSGTALQLCCDLSDVRSEYCEVFGLTLRYG